MSGFLDFLLSPLGLLAYAAFWAFKLTLGAWLLRRAMVFLPVGARLRLAEFRPRIGWPGRRA